MEKKSIDLGHRKYVFDRVACKSGKNVIASFKAICCK